MNTNELSLDHPLLVSSLEAAGWQGTDASLEISLFEYDFAWREQDRDESGDDIVILYRVRGNQFDSVALDSRRDLYKEYSWCSPEQWAGFYDLHGTCKEDWDALSFTWRMYDLYHAWGYDNIFGGSYGGLFTIIDPQDEVEEESIPDPARYFLWHDGRYRNPNGRMVYTSSGRYGARSMPLPDRVLRSKRPAHEHVSPTWEDFED